MLHNINVAFKNLSLLSAEEKTLFNNYADLIRSKDLTEEELANVIKELSGAPLSLLYKFSENDPEFKRFFAAHPKLDEVWARRLEKLGYIPEPLFSPDNKTHIPLFSQLMGALLWSQQSNCIDPVERNKYMDAAAELGIHAAIYDCMQRNLKAIEKALTKEDLSFNEITQLINHHADQIFLYGEKLGSQFWSMGYLYAAITLLQVADTAYERIDKLSMERSNMTKSKIDEELLTIRCLKAAIKYAVFSQALENTDQSQKILKVLSPHGIFSTYTDHFKDWGEAQAYVMAYGKTLNIPHPEKLMQSVMEEAEADIAKLNLSSSSSSKAATPAKEFK
ncbi:MAG: DUF5630 domain-containing protein [Gammaproteobacteria bacterium]|nr:DUF5630 domain-containing protein [Gammaproteobacteria bacterium]